MPEQNTQRVVVIGGGILGVTTALNLVAGGAAVTLVTEGRLADGASSRSLSWLNTAGVRSPEYHQLRLLGIDRYRTFAARNDASDYLRFDGGLTWAPAGRSFAPTFEHEKAIGYDARWLRPEEIAGWTPGVDPSAVAAEGAIYNPGEGWVDLPSLISELVDRYVALGGTLLEHAGHATVLVEDGRARGAALADGRRLPADSVLLAGGAAVPSELVNYGITIADQSPIALLVWTKPVQIALTAVLNTPRVAVRPTPSGALALDSAWSEEALVVDGDGRITVPEGVLDCLLAEASRVLAGNPALELDGYAVGPKPIPGDGEPVLGEVAGLEGFYIAFTHSGATLGLIAGELLAHEMLSGEKSPLLATFRPERFASTLAG